MVVFHVWLMESTIGDDISSDYHLLDAFDPRISVFISKYLPRPRTFLYVCYTVCMVSAMAIQRYTSTLRIKQKLQKKKKQTVSKAILYFQRMGEANSET